MSNENLVKNKLIENADLLLNLERIFQNNCLDIAQYKIPFLKRRMERRMHIKEISDFMEYLDLLENDSSELTCLLESLSIHVTSFFRDASIFNTLETVIIPEIISNLENKQMINVWSAGCASGEEPYSIAILLKDLSEISKNMGICIQATDINKKDIEIAQNGKYPSKLLEHVSPVLKNKYFKKIEEDGYSEYEVISNIKKLINFEISDILSSSENKYDIIFCRNLLMYYESEAQEIILKKLHNCLKNNGYLIIGSDELLMGKKLKNMFHPVMPKEKIFQKISS